METLGKYREHVQGLSLTDDELEELIGIIKGVTERVLDDLYKVE